MCYRGFTEPLSVCHNDLAVPGCPGVPWLPRPPTIPCERRCAPQRGVHTHPGGGHKVDIFVTRCGSRGPPGPGPKAKTRRYPSSGMSSKSKATCGRWLQFYIPVGGVTDLFSPPPPIGYNPSLVHCIRFRTLSPRKSIQELTVLFVKLLQLHVFPP